MTNKPLTILSLFDGVSIAKQALKELDIPNNYFASEIDKYAITVSKYRHPDIIHIGDVKNVSFSKDPNSKNGFLHTEIKTPDNDYVKEHDLILNLPYKQNISSKINFTKDIENIPAVDPGYEVDLMIGGSPCQDLSVAKQNRQGLAGSKSSLFYEYLRILKETKPKYFILENVASMKKQDMETITRELFNVRTEGDWHNISNNRDWNTFINTNVSSKYEYMFTNVKIDFEYLNIEQMINPAIYNLCVKEIFERLNSTNCRNVGCLMINASLVSAQSRKRLFWVGKWNEDIQWYDWIDIPQPEDRGIILKDVLLPLSQIDSKYILSDRELKYGNSHNSDNAKSQAMVSNLSKGVPYNVLKDNRELQFLGSIGNNTSQGNRVYGVDGKNCTLSANGGGLGAKTGLIAIYPDNPQMYREVRTELGKQIRREVKLQNGIDITPKNKDTKMLILKDDDKANCITTSSSKEGILNDGAIIRKLHPIETERLQSLPDTYSAFGMNEKNETVNISDTQRYKMMGNGFNCNVIKHILTHLNLTN